MIQNAAVTPELIVIPAWLAAAGGIPNRADEAPSATPMIAEIA